MKTVKVKYDVAVLGAGPGGITAAIQAARNGARTILVEREGLLGGNINQWLPWMSFLTRGGVQVVGGLAQEFVDRLMAKGACLGHNTCPWQISVTSIDINIFQAEA